ncbi:hypothetical protein V1504DRAFT_436402 [Lipomyces starkeyi]
MAGIPEHVYRESTMVRRHLRVQHRVEVAPGNAKLGRPRPHAGPDDAATRRLSRLVVRWRKHGVTKKMVQAHVEKVQYSGLSEASKSATFVDALEPLCEVSPVYRELVAFYKTKVNFNKNVGEISRVELSWSMVEAGWLPISIDREQLAPGQITETDLVEWSRVAMHQCVGQLVVERFVRRPEDQSTHRPVEFTPLLHFQAGGAEAVWREVKDIALEYAAHAYPEGLSVPAARLARAYVVPWILAKILHHHLNILPGDIEWTLMDRHFYAYPEERIGPPKPQLPCIPGDVVPLPVELLQSGGTQLV